jgi:hypothetical protein
MPESRTARILLSETILPAIEVRRRIQAGKPFAFLGLYFQTADGSSSSTSGSDSNVPGELGSIGAGQEPGLAQRRTYPGCLHGDGRHLELGIFRSTKEFCTRTPATVVLDNQRATKIGSRKASGLLLVPSFPPPRFLGSPASATTLKRRTCRPSPFFPTLCFLGSPPAPKPPPTRYPTYGTQKSPGPLGFPLGSARSGLTNRNR